MQPIQPTAPTEQQLRNAATAFITYCTTLSDEQFFWQPEGKWSAAQQVKHLITSTNMARLAFRLPAFMVRWIGGTPNRPSRSYDELVEKYHLKLSQGGRASGRYIPKSIPPSYGKEKLLNGFRKSMEQFALACTRGKQGNHPDQYLAPHPLLGKITLRELCYFTIHHAYHHLDSIRKMIEEQPTR
jgi:DinB superfamily